MSDIIKKIDTIHIDGHAFLVAPDEEVVPLAPLCHAIGIDAQAQQRRIDRAAWATTAIMAVVAGDGNSGAGSRPARSSPKRSASPTRTARIAPPSALGFGARDSVRAER